VSWASRDESHGNGEPVIGEFHALRQGAIGFRVRQLVSNVGEKSAFCTDAAGPGDGLIERGMAGVRLAAQSGEDDAVEALEEGKALFGNVADVGEVGGLTEAESVNELLTMADGNADEVDAVNRHALLEREDFYAGAVRVSGRRGKGVVVDAIEDAGGFAGGVKRDDAAFSSDGEAEGSEIIQAEDVVCVIVGIEDGIDAVEPASESLLAEVGSGVNDGDALMAVLEPAEQDGWAQTAVVGVG
jgi:hypothetical protein